MNDFSKRLVHRAKAWRPGPAWWTVLAGVACAALTALKIHNRLILTMDGWGYWEGSVSLLNGDGYRYFGGQPITAFPPLFSLFLAVVQLICGVSGKALILATVMLAGGAGGAWMLLSQKLAAEQTSPWPRLALLVFLGAFIRLHYGMLLSENLFLVIYPLILLAAIGIRGDRPDWPGVCALTALATGALLTRNSFVVFLPGVAAVACIAGKRGGLAWPRRAALAACAAGVPIAAWYAVRLVLGQADSHHLHWGGKETPLHYARQMWGDLTGVLGQTRWRGGLLLLSGWGLLFEGWRTNRDKTRPVIQAAGISLLGLAGLYLLFNLTVIDDPLTGRFLTFLPLTLAACLAPLAGLRQRSRLQTLAIWLVLLSMTAIQAGRVMPGIIADLQRDQEHASSLEIVRPNMILSPAFIRGTPRRNGGQVLIAPPTFNWQNRRNVQQPQPAASPQRGRLESLPQGVGGGKRS